MFWTNHIQDCSKVCMAIVLAVFVLIHLSKATQANERSGLTATLAEIHADPWKYHGQTVRVRGFVDVCRSLVCSICTELAPTYSRDSDEICMGLSFSAPKFFPKEKAERDDRHASIGRDMALEAERIAQFSELTIESDYDASCSGVPEGLKRGDELPRNETGGLDEIIVCTDRGTEFVGANIVKVHHWFAPRDYVEISYRGNDIKKPTNGEEKAIRAAFAQALSVYSYPGDKEPQFVFLLEESSDAPGRLQAEGGVCFCTLDKCSAKDWPVVEAHADRLVGNAFYCHHAEKVGGVWRFIVN